MKHFQLFYVITFFLICRGFLHGQSIKSWFYGDDMIHSVAFMVGQIVYYTLHSKLSLYLSKKDEVTRTRCLVQFYVGAGVCVCVCLCVSVCVVVYIVGKGRATD